MNTTYPEACLRPVVRPSWRRSAVGSILPPRAQADLLYLAARAADAARNFRRRATKTL